MARSPTEDRCSKCPFEYQTQADLISHQTAHHSGHWPQDARLLNENWLGERYDGTTSSIEEIRKEINSDHRGPEYHPVSHWEIIQFIWLFFGSSGPATDSQYYGADWEIKREAALRRDGFICQGCGTSESDMDSSLHVHHIKPLREFEEPEHANMLDNLVSLCPSCHGKWEGIPIRPVHGTD